MKLIIHTYYDHTDYNNNYYYNLPYTSIIILFRGFQYIFIRTRINSEVIIRENN